MNLRSVLAVLFAFSAFTLSANAAPITGQILINGYAEANGSPNMDAATGLDFSTNSTGTFSGNSGGLTSYGAGAGSFAGLTCNSSSGGCGTIMDIASFASETATSDFLTLATGGPAISFDLTSISGITHTAGPNGGSLTLTALGTINFSGYAATAGQLTLVADGTNDVSYTATLSAGPVTPSATPEPSSLILLAGPMLAGAVQQLRRKTRFARS